jgi:hypothetical protein
MAKHSIVPDRSLFGKLGARSRALPMVCTELVDNSLDSWMMLPKSKKGSKKLKVEIIPSESRTRSSWFIIKDNAGGMNEKELALALTVAHSDKTKKGNLIGSYGFGLKSAAMYIGSKFRIYTCSHKEPRSIYYLEFDKVKFEDAKGKWEIEIKKMTKKDAAKHEVYFPDGHGTEIKILNERYKSANKNGIIKRLSRIFGPRLSKERGALGVTLGPKERMILKFKGVELKADGPFYNPYIAQGKDDRASKKSNLTISEELKGIQTEASVLPANTKLNYKLVVIPRTKIATGKYVEGIIGVLDRGMAHSNHYGFDLIKNGRVIETHVLDRDSKSKRVGLVASNHNARIVGQLRLDDLNWKTDHQKTEFMKDEDDWETLSNLIHKKISSLYKVSSYLQYPNKDKKKEDQPSSLATKVFEGALPEINKNAQKNSRSSEIKKVLKDFSSTTSEEIKKKPKKIKPKTVSKIASVKFHLDYSHNGAEAPLVSKKETTSKGKIIYTVKLNLDHHFLSNRESAELKVIGEYILLDAQSEYYLKAKGSVYFDDFLEIRDKVFIEYKR